MHEKRGLECVGNGQQSDQHRKRSLPSEETFNALPHHVVGQRSTHGTAFYKWDILYRYVCGSGSDGPNQGKKRETSSNLKRAVASSPLCINFHPSVAIPQDWVRGPGIRVQSSGFRVQGSGFRV